MNHVRGATKLLELRGVEQLNSHAGLELFTLVRLQNVGNSLSSQFLSWSDLLFLGTQWGIFQSFEPLFTNDSGIVKSRQIQAG